MGKLGKGSPRKASLKRWCLRKDLKVVRERESFCYMGKLCLGRRDREFNDSEARTYLTGMVKEGKIAMSRSSVTVAKTSGRCRSWEVTRRTKVSRHADSVKSLIESGNIFGLEDIILKWDKPLTSKIVKLIETKNRMVTARGWGRGKNGVANQWV